MTPKRKNALGGGGAEGEGQCQISLGKCPTPTAFVVMNTVALKTSWAQNPEKKMSFWHDEKGAADKPGCAEL